MGRRPFRTTNTSGAAAARKRAKGCSVAQQNEYHTAGGRITRHGGGGVLPAECLLRRGDERHNGRSATGGTHVAHTTRTFQRLDDLTPALMGVGVSGGKPFSTTSSN